MALFVSRTVAVVLALSVSLMATSVYADGVKLPQTASDHITLAKQYEEKAAEWRKEAAYHREMAAAYNRNYPDHKGGIRNQAAAKMEKHCMSIAQGAEKLAASAEESARYHHLRAKEFEGK